MLLCTFSGNNFLNFKRKEIGDLGAWRIDFLDRHMINTKYLDCKLLPCYANEKNEQMEKCKL